MSKFENVDRLNSYFKNKKIYAIYFDKHQKNRRSPHNKKTEVCNLCFLLLASRELSSMTNLKALLSIAVINSMYVLMAFGAYYVHQGIGDNGFWMTLIIGVFGVLCGWTIGALSSPIDVGESKAFTKYAGVISGFASGYLFTKVDGVIVGISENLLANPAYGLRVLIFSSCLISGVLIMYILRAYLREQESANKEIQPTQNMHG